MLFRSSIYSFIYSLPQHIYCSFGALWIFILMGAISYVKSFYSLINPILLIVLAYSVQFITNDGTRISLLITGSSIIIFIMVFSEKFEKQMILHRYILLSSFVAPAIIVQNIYINPSYRQIMMLFKSFFY